MLSSIDDASCHPSSSNEWRYKGSSSTASRAPAGRRTRHPRPAKQKQPDEDHDDQPEDQAGERRPFGDLSLLEASHDREPQRQGLDLVPERSVADRAYDVEGDEDGERAVGDDFRGAIHRGVLPGMDLTGSHASYIVKVFR